MADIKDIYRHLVTMEHPKTKDYWEHLNKILDFVDKNYYLDENFIYSLSYYRNINFKIPLYFYQENLNVWPEKKVNKFVEVIFEVFSDFYMLRGKILNQPFFVEIKSMMNFFTERIVKDKILSDSHQFTIMDNNLFFQSESFQYLFTIFDKLNYIFEHFSEKYAKDEVKHSDSMDSKFHINFYENIAPFAKGEEEKFKIKKVLDIITESTTWHYVRKLRNNIAHHFFNPKLTYNLSIEIKLLYINICRIVFLLDATIKKDSELMEYINRSKN